MENKELCIVDVEHLNKDNILELLAMIHSDLTIKAINTVDISTHNLHKILTTIKYLRSKLQHHNYASLSEIRNYVHDGYGSSFWAFSFIFTGIKLPSLGITESTLYNTEEWKHIISTLTAVKVQEIYDICKELCFWHKNSRKDPQRRNHSELSNFYHLLEYYYDAYLDTANQSKVAQLKQLELQAQKYDELFASTNARNVELDKQMQELKTKEQQLMEMQKVIKTLEDNVKRNNTYFKPHFYAKMKCKIWDITYLEKSATDGSPEFVGYVLNRIAKIKQFLSKNPNFLVFLDKPYPDRKMCEFCNELYKKYSAIFDAFKRDETHIIQLYMSQPSIQSFLDHLEISNLNVGVEGM